MQFFIGLVFRLFDTERARMGDCDLSKLQKEKNTTFASKLVFC